MKRLVFSIIIVSLFFALLPLKASDAAVMEDYCIVPPYVIQDVAPNVMIVLDNSGSMLNFAYFDGFHTTDTSDDRGCAGTTDAEPPCTTCICKGFTYPGTYPTYKYYGYFNPDYWYTYSSTRFEPAARKTEARPANSWDGNFLNWLTMRRVDVIRKVMAGGKSTGSGANTRLLGQIADYDERGIYKQILNANDYTPYSGNRTFTFSTVGSATSSFSVSGIGGTFSVDVVVPPPVEGVLQEVVGARARLGLSFYRANNPTPHGGFVQVNVGSGSLSSIVKQINNDPSSLMGTTNTPLAETLWTMTGYFAQQATIEGGPGPRYSSGDFQINNNVDPYNYGTGGQPRWPSCSKSYVLYITDGEPCADGYLPTNLRDYASGKSAYNCSGTSCPAVGSFPASTFPTCTGGGESTSCNGVVSGCYVAGIEDVALYMHTTDLRNSPTVGVNNMSGIQNLTLYAVFAFGKGSTLLRYAAINGGFEDANGNNQPDLQTEWDNNGDGEPDNFYEADEGYALEQAIRNAFSSILKRASSGTAASVLASGEGSGANLVQAIFYPRRRFGNDIIGWTGESQNFWYYVDPFFTNSSIREDTVSDEILNLSNDYIVQFYFDQTAQITMARRCQDIDGDGDADAARPTVTFENVASLWKSGYLLWSRNITTDPRIIYTTINGTTYLSENFSTTNASTLRPYLDVANDTLAEDVIRYIHGEGLTTLRDEDGNIVIAGVDRNADGIDDYRPRYATIGGVTNVWKLGDVLDSTPRIASWIQLSDYDSRYSDTTYSSFINSFDYKSRGMVFAGGNDGMLHAFKLGTLELSGAWKDTVTKKAKLTGSELGKEMWAFIPKHALPYLKYITDPDYCHVYTVDLPPYVFDASINGNPDDTKDVNSWRTILIGGMRTGGACRGTTVACSDVSGDGNKDCVNTPVDVDGSGVGFSSYFALDVTDQNNPQLLWEFSNPQLGFTTTGPAVVRIGADKNKNGKWFAVFGSGPTGPIDTTNNQFMGRSDQNLRLFVLDLKTGNLLTNPPIDTGIQYAFAGSMLNTTLDSDLNYQDDVVYIPYVKRGDGTWNQGGVLRLLTKEDPTPSNWVWSYVMDNIGPVTSSVTKLLNKNKGILWLYFGTGRYYFELGATTDDPTTQRQLFGVKEPCFSSSGFGLSCTTPVSGLTNVTSISSVPTETTANSDSFKGWYIGLDPSDNYSYCEAYSESGPCQASCVQSVSRAYRAERMITDPMSTTTGMVFFTTYKPYSDECGLGGKSFIWALRYNTGGCASASLKGVALLQVSTGSIEQVNLSTAFTEKGGRRTSAMEGVPPTAQGLSLLSQPPPVKRTIHMRER